MPGTVDRGMVSGSGRARRVAVLRCLIAALVITILLAGLVVLIIWLVVRPKPIDYAVTRASVRHFSVTPGGNATVNATFYLTFAASNPNRRVSMRYDQVEFCVLYGESLDSKPELAVAYAPPFRQPRRNETRLDVRAVARSVPVPERAARELEHDRAAGEVAVDVRVHARVRFKVGEVATRHYSLQAFCSPVVVGLTPASARSFRTVPCDVAIS